MHHTRIPQFARERGRMARPKRTIDPLMTAVIAIDFQRFFIDDGQPMAMSHAADALENANRINEAARAAGSLVVHTQHSFAEPGVDLEDASAQQTLLPSSPSFDFHPSLVRDASDVSIIKHRSSPLHPRSGTRLLELLRERSIDTVVITGLATNGCCDCTARDAYQHGFNVIIATDATATLTDEEHNASLLGLTLFYAEPMETDEIVSQLAQSLK